MKTMKAAVYYNNRDIRIEAVAIPEIGPGEMLVKTIACGLCGGEAMEWYHSKRAPKVMGHETAGIVAEVGKRVTLFKKGDRIFVNHHVSYLNSHLSMRGKYTKDHNYHKSHLDPGGMCEYFRVTEDHVGNSTILLPDDMDFGQATTLEPWGCVIGGLKAACIQPGDTVAVVGSGFMGQGFVHLAPLFGAGQVIACDLSDFRLEKARQAGASAVINSSKEDPIEALKSLNDGRGADVVISTVPLNSVIDQAYRMVHIGGTLHLNAPPPPEAVWSFSPGDMYFREINITTKYSADHIDIKQAFNFLKSSRMKPEFAITHRFPLEGIHEAFDLLLKGDKSLKSIVYPHGIEGE